MSPRSTDKDHRESFMPENGSRPASALTESVGILVPTGMLGAGFDQATIARGLALGADVIAVDGGSTDSGPYYLGAGEAKTADEAIRRDLRMLLAAVSQAGIPLHVGSSATSRTASRGPWGPAT